jgi:hypothetical protein
MCDTFGMIILPKLGMNGENFAYYLEPCSKNKYENLMQHVDFADNGA